VESGAEAREAFDRILLRAERTRAGLVAAFFGALTLALLLRVAVEAARGMPEALGLAIGIFVFLGSVTALELFLRRDATVRLRDDRPPSDLVAYTFTVVEICAYTAGNTVLGIAGDGVIVLTFALVALSAFRLMPSATFLSGVTAAAAYLVLVWSVRPEALTGPGAAERAVWTAALIVASGGAIALMARTVRQAALRLATEAVRRQRLQADLLASVETTQAFIGRDLHDGVGSHLTGLSFYVRALVRRLERGEPVAAEEMAEAAAMVDEGIRQVRHLAHGLTPSEMEPGGLPSALADLAAATTQATGVAVAFRADAPLPRLRVEAERHLYRIAQEAVTNAIKHAQPRRIEIDLAAEGDALVLSVEDDGIGLVPGPNRTKTVGLRSMRHRADLADGTLDISPGIERGTTVRVVVAGSDGSEADAPQRASIQSEQGEARTAESSRRG
jgi:signal transduction histidine kinase